MKSSSSHSGMSLPDQDRDGLGVAVCEPPPERQAAVPASKACRRKRVAMLTLLVILLNPLGNLALAWGMKHIAGTVSLNPMGYVHALFNPFTAMGVALLILWLLTRMALMSWADLSFILPVTAVGYALSALFGQVFLDEKVSRTHWIGILLIVLGAALAGTHYSRTKGKSH